MKQIRKLTALLCVIVLTATSLVGLEGMSSEVEAATSTQSTDATQYEEKIEYTEVASDQFESISESLDTTRVMVDAKVATDPHDANNKVIEYSQSSGDGFIVATKDNSISQIGDFEKNSIKAEAGASYHVTFDYKASGTPNSDLPVYFGVGTTDLNNNLYEDGKRYRVPVKNELFKLNAKQSYSDTSWNKLDTIITLPETWDDTGNVGFVSGLGTKADSLVIMMCLGGPASLYIDNLKIEKVNKVQSELVSYNDYNDGIVCDSVWQVYNAMVDCYPTFDPLTNSNKVVRYRQSNGEGYIILGSNCRGSNANYFIADAVSAVAGTTYTITFDYLATRTTKSTGTQVALFVGSAGGGRTVAREGNRTQSFLSEPILKFDPYTDISTDGWVRNYTATVTVPEGTDLTTNGDKLLLECSNGSNQACLYIDNVKVTANTTTENLATDNVDYFADFTGATPLAEDGRNWGGYYGTSGDIAPYTDPTDENNIVLRLNKSRVGNHNIVLGADYKSDDANQIVNSSFKPIKGASYEIEFDWYHQKGTSASDVNDVVVYAAIRSVHANCGKTEEDGGEGNTCAWKSEILRVTADDSRTGWQKVKATVAIPYDVIMEDNSALVIYVDANVVNYIGGGRVFYFDNVSCSGISPVSAQITVGADHSSKIYDKDSFELEALYPTDVVNQKAVKWYKDKNRTEAFDYNAVKEDLPLILNLYGEYEKADAAFAIGDNNNDGKVGEDDVQVLRNYYVESPGMVYSTEKADANGDGAVDLKDLIRTKKAVINSVSGWKLSYSGVSEANQNLAAMYLGTSVEAADRTITLNQTESGSHYSIDVSGNGKHITVNADGEHAMAAAIMSLKSYIASGRDFTDGCLLAFDYIGSGSPTAVSADETMYQDDFVTRKEATLFGQVEIAEPAATIEYNALDTVTTQLGTDFVNEMKANIVSDFEKEGDKMVHVSSFVIIKDVVYMTYYVNETTQDENPTYQKARLVTAPLNDLNNKTYYTIQSSGDECGGKLVNALYDTILMYKDGTIYVMWTANLSGNYYRLYRTYDLDTKEFSDVKINRFKVGNITNDL